jgi:hypothetical protein
MGIRPQIGHLQTAQLVAAQPERIGRLDHLGVTQRNQRPFAARAGHPIHPVIQEIEQHL